MWVVGSTGGCWGQVAVFIKLVAKAPGCTMITRMLKGVNSRDRDSDIPVSGGELVSKLCC